MPKRSQDPARGREAVQTALLEAASDLLAEVGPRATSVRDIAARAGVNHGQVHHYFGGKRPLLKEAMRQMARRHFDEIRALSQGRALPPPLANVSDDRYWRAAVRAVIEGDMELARVEVDDGVSVTRNVLEHLTRKAGLDEPDLDIKLALAEGTAMQLGWMVLEPFLFLVADVKPEEEELLRQRVREIAYQTRIHRPT